MKNNRDVYDNFVHEYTGYELTVPEQIILQQLKNNWHKIRMLDIGVGTGRTSYTFSSLVKEYIGIDYSSPMLERCKEMIGEHESVKFEVMDARDLSKFYDQPFDFVMFSLNGIDSVCHEDRQKILSEIYKVTAKNGMFKFSTHSLHAFPFKVKFPEFKISKPIRSIYRWLKPLRRAFRLWWHYRGVDVSEIKNKPWAVLATGDHNFEIQIYHVKPDYQLKELEKIGFEVVSAYDKYGIERDLMTDTSGNYMNILCKPKG